MRTITTNRKRAIATILVALSLASVACANRDSSSGTAGERGHRSNEADGNGGVDSADAGPASAGARVDPRDDGLEVALGEWAVTLEAGAIRPGRVTFVVHNRGTIPHGFEIEAEDEGDSSGSGSGDGLKAETELLQPGETARLALDLLPGLYKVECLVDGHDDLGMEGFLEVRMDAPLVRDRSAAGGTDAAGSGGANDVSIQDFTFAPADLEVAQGTEVTWTNEDPAPHTVTAEDGSFDSGTLEPGQTFSVSVQGNGPITYRCEIHPAMVGAITVR
ncbi:MAG: plastocyanin/azurin family copper-binding protein [Actinomycetota bacterium]